MGKPYMTAKEFLGAFKEKTACRLAAQRRWPGFLLRCCYPPV
jgi:hypothetical protein